MSKRGKSDDEDHALWARVAETATPLGKRKQARVKPISLKPERSHHAPKPEAAPERQSAGTETILLVEDEPALRSLTKRILSSAGYTVIEADSGDKALAVLAAHTGPVHLLLTDVVMPGMNGRDLATRVAAARPEIRVLFASGYTDDAILRHGVLDDGSRFISKPYAPGELRRKIREALS